MHLNPSTNGALRILMICRKSPGRPVTMPEMVRHLGLSESLVVKSCHELMRAGYIRGRRGNGGGYKLARAAESIDVMEIIELFEGEENLFPCRLAQDEECRIVTACLLRVACERAYSAFKNELKGWSLADIAADMDFDAGVSMPSAC